MDKDILWPGNPEIAAKYREKSYYFSSAEARDKFLEDPTVYLPKGKPVKVCIGPRATCSKFSS